MNGADPLAQLRDIHLPQAVDWWPLAPGWWLLLALLLGALGALAVWLTRRHRANLYRRQALAELAQLQTRGDNAAADVIALLRRCAECAYPGRHLGSLPLDDFLKQLASGVSRPVFHFAPDELQLALYSAQRSQTPHMQLYTDSAIWIRQHRRGQAC